MVGAAACAASKQVTAAKTKAPKNRCGLTAGALLNAGLCAVARMATHAARQRQFRRRDGVGPIAWDHHGVAHAYMFRQWCASGHGAQLFERHRPAAKPSRPGYDKWIQPLKQVSSQAASHANIRRRFTMGANTSGKRIAGQRWRALR